MLNTNSITIMHRPMFSDDVPFDEDTYSMWYYVPNKKHGVCGEYFSHEDVPNTRPIYERARLVTAEKLRSIVEGNHQNQEFSFVAVFGEKEILLPKIETHIVQIINIKFSTRDGIRMYKLKTTPFSAQEYNEITVAYLDKDAFEKQHYLNFDPNDQEAKQKYVTNAISAEFGYAYDDDPAFKEDWAKRQPCLKPKENRFRACYLFLETFSLEDWENTNRAVADWLATLKDYYQKRAAAEAAVMEVNKTYRSLVDKGMQDAYESVVQGIESDLPSQKRNRLVASDEQ